MTTLKSKNKFLKVATSTALVASTFSTIAAPISAASFPDIEKSSHKYSIEQLLSQGIVKGYDDGTFKPGKSITRGQAAKIIASVLKLDTTNVKNPNFTDIHTEMEFYPYIAALAEAEIISGYQDGSFKPQQTITRGQMAKMIAIGFSLTTEKRHPFTDVSAKSQYSPFIAALYANEVTTGTTETTFSPAKHVTRGQLASFVIRAEKIQSKPTTGTVSGKISKVNANEVVINGKTLNVANNLTKTFEHNSEALTEANVAVTVTNNEVTAIEKLELSSAATTFDGQGLVLKELSLPATVTTIANVTADTIYYHVAKVALTANNVSAKEFYLNNEKVVVASTSTTNLPTNNANVTFNGSTVNHLYSNVHQATIAKTNSTINNLTAKNTSTLTLNGDFANVTVAENTVVNGKAKIEMLHFDGQPANYSFAADINVAKVVVADKTYTWSDFLTQFPAKENAGSETGGSTIGSGSSTGGGSNSGGSTGGGSNTDRTPEPPKDVIAIDDTSNKVTIGENSFEVTEEQMAFLAEQKENIKELTLTTNDKNETIIEKIVVQTDKFDGTTLTSTAVEQLILTATAIENVSNVEKLVVISSQPTTLSNVTVATIEASGPITQIKDTTADQISLNTNSKEIYITNTNADVAINGTVESIVGTVNGALAVTSSSPTLLITANANTIDLQETKANVIVRGQAETISGGAGNTLTIASAANAINVANVGSSEIIIVEAPKLAVASLSMMRTFANTSTMTIKFSGNYSDKTLTVKRDDTIVDVQSPNPFSTLTVEGNRTLISSNTMLADVHVRAGVTQVGLNANVEEFKFDLSSRIEIMSSNGATINHLIVTTKTSDDTKGYITSNNITVNKVTLDNVENTPLTNDVFKQAISNGSFVSSLTPPNFPNFGKAKIVLPTGLTGSISVLHVSETDDYRRYLNVSTVPSKAVPYTVNSLFFLEAETSHLIVYANDGGTIKESVIDTSNIDKYLVSPNVDTGDVKVFTRYALDTPLKDTMQYLYIFDEGKLVYENTTFKDITQTVDKNGIRSFTLNTGIKGLNNSAETYISKDVIYHYGDSDISAQYFTPILKELAAKAYEAKKPEMIKLLLAEMSSKSAATFDSLFLADYVKELVTNPNSYNTTKDILDLIEDLTPQYQLDIQLSAADLYLNSLPLATSASYSVPNIVKVENALPAEKLLFTPLSEGTTTVRVADKNGVASLINVTVTKDTKGKLIIPADGYEVIATKADSGTLLDGSNNFRFFTNANGTFLVPTKLESSFALVKLATPANNPISSVVNGYALTQDATNYTLSAKREITPVEIKLADIALQSIKGLTVKNIGVLGNATGDGIILFPRTAGSEIAYFADDQNVTAVNVTSTDNTVTYDIAKSTVTLNIASDLKLDAITNTTMYPQGSLDIHYTNDGDKVQFYANKAAKVSYVFSDSANKKTIVNVTSEEANNKLTVANGDIVKGDLSKDADTPINTGATVSNISGTSVRAHGLEIFATQTGTSIVTLSNGKQYQFEVKQSSNQFIMTYEEVENFTINAATLHMTNIKEATSSNASDRLQVVDGKLVVNLAANGTSKITIKSDTEPVETTVLYVTKTADSYKTFDAATDVVRAELTAAQLGLTTVTNAFGDATPTARIKVADGKVYVYGFTEGTRLFRVNDGTNNSAINATVSTNATTDQLEVTAAAVTHPMATAANGALTSTAARVVGNTLYATGLGLDTNGKATIEVPVAHTDSNVEAFYAIGLTQNQDSKLLSFDAQGTKTFKTYLNKADFDFSTLHSTTVTAIDGNNITAEVAGDRLLVTATDDSEARIQVNESASSNAKAYVYVKRNGENFTAKIEKSTATALKDYGYTTTPTLSLVGIEGIVRPHIDSNLNVDFYGLAVGKTAYKFEDGKGKNLFVNVDVTGSTDRTVTATIVKEQLSGEATIIEGNAVRLSSDKTTLYANEVGATSIVKHADGTFAQYKVIENADGQFEIEPTPIAKSATITKTALGLTGDLQVSGLDGAMATYSLTNDGIIVYGNSNGKTSMIVSNGSKSVVVNVTVEDSGVTISNPVSTTTNTAPTLVHAEDANISRIDGTTIYALANGVAEVLVGNTVQQITVTKADNQYTISEPVHISDAVYTAADLGFAANASTTIEAGNYETNFSVSKVDDKIVAFSKLADGATGTAEFIVNASGERTLVNLNDTGAALIQSTIAVQENAIHADAQIANETVARQKAGTLYPLKAGSTHATLNGYIQSIEVKRTNGLLQAAVSPVKLDGTFTVLTETDTSIIGIESDGVYAKKTSGTTVVQLDNQVYEVTITTTNGKVEIAKKAISSKSLLAADAQLADINTAEVLYPTNSEAVTLSILDKNNTKNGIAIYSNTKQARSLAVLVTDSNGDKALIDVTIDETGNITKAEYVKQTKTVAFSTDQPEVKQETNARGVWNGTTLTTYAIGEGNAALKFKNGLVNVITSKTATNKVTMSTDVLAHTGFTATLNSITNGTMLKATTDGFYPIDTGSALVHADDKVYSVNVKLEYGLYKLDVSNGVPFTELSIGTNDTYSIIGSTLNGVSVAIDADANDDSVEDNKKLIIYKIGDVAGTSDLLITSGGVNTVHHVKTDGTSVETPVLSKGTIDTAITGPTIIGDSIRLSNTDVYYLAEKASTIQATDRRLVTMDVKRDGNGYFTATPEYVKGTVTAAPATLSNYIIDGTTIYAKSTDVANATEVKLITDPTDTTNVKAFYTTFSTTRTGGKFAVEIDERKAYQYDLDATFGLTTATKTIDNTNSNIATAKVIGDKLVIIAGDGVGETTITLEDDKNKQLVIKASRQNDGTFVVTPQAGLNSLLFADIDLDASTDTITAEGFDAAVITVKETSTGLNITANKVGTTSLQLKQDGNVVGLVNVVVEKNINDKLQITSTPISYTVAGTPLYSNGGPRVDKVDTTNFYATATGKTLYETTTGAQFINVTKNATTKLYEVSNTAHTLKTFDQNDLGLTALNTAVPATATVGTLISTEQDKLYVYGQGTGTTDIVVSDGTSNTVIVATNGVSLTTAVARKAIEDTALAAATWKSSAATVATARNGFIYTQETGAAVLESTINSHKVFMNVIVSRNENRTFNIVPEVVSVTNTNWTAVEVLTGTDVVVKDGTTLYAQQTGTATVKVTDNTSTKVYTVTVSENANGTLKMALSQPMTHVAITAEELGLTTLTPTQVAVNSINGAGVVTAQITNNELIILAKNSGQAEVSVNNGQTTVHVQVTDEAGTLKVTPTIAKTTITGAADVSKSKGEDNVVRFVKTATGTDVYALKAGKLIAKVDGELHNINVVKENNKLVTTVDRIEYDFGSAPTITDGTAVKVDGTKVVAVNYKSETVTVDGKTYKVTVNEDGTMDVVLFAASSFDFAQSKLKDLFTDVTSATITSNKGLTTATKAGSTVTLTPVDNLTTVGTDIITVSNGTQTVQLKATIESVTGGFAVTSIELVSKTLNASDLNSIYAASILNVNGQPFNSPFGLLRTENGILTVYPGAAGEADFIVRDSENNQSLFSLISTPTDSDASFVVKPVTLTVPFNSFSYVPNVIATNGKASAKNVGQDLAIHFANTDETVFVTSSGQSLYHTVLVRPKVSTDKPTTFDVSDHVITAVTPIEGEITNVTPGLHSISHNGKTIIYAMKDTPTTAYFTDPNGFLNKVTVGANYALTTEKVYAIGEVTYTSLELKQGTDVVALDGSKLAAKATGTGIYKTDSNDYVEITISGNQTSGYTVQTKQLAKKALNTIGTSLTVLAPTTGVYLDDTTIYGETTEKVAISNGQAIYTATMADGAFSEFKKLELNLTTELGWSSFDSHTLVTGSQFGSIDGTSFIPKSVNTDGEIITFTTATGIKKQLTIKVNDDLTFTVEAGKDEISYHFASVGTYIQLTFDMNLNTLPESMDFIVDQDNSIYPTDAALLIYTGNNMNYEGTFTINVPEYDQTTQPLGKSFTIKTEKVGTKWSVPTITSDKIKFIHTIK